MAVNEVVINGKTVIDLKGDTVTPETLAAGKTAHNSSGDLIVGVMTSGGAADRLIEVEKLPTENINESAVYKTREEEETEIWFVCDGEKKTLVQALELESIAIHCVDSLPESVEFTEDDISLYVVRPTGIAYMPVDEVTFVSLGMALFESEGYDKGWADNIDAIDPADESNMGLWCVRGKTYEVYCTYISGTWQKYYSEDRIEDSLAEFLSKEVSQYVVPDSVKALKRGCFAYSQMSSVSLPDGLRKIGPYAFCNCSNLDICALPDSVQEISQRAFYGCFALTEITLPENLQKLDIDAFSACDGIASIVIPSQVAYIDLAFRNCYALNSVTFKGKPDYISQLTFSGSDNLTQLNVPWSEGEVEGAPWGAANATVNYNCV